MHLPQYRIFLTLFCMFQGVKKLVKQAQNGIRVFPYFVLNLFN